MAGRKSDAEIAQMLSSLDPRVTHLDLRSNRLTGAGCAALQTFLESNHELIELDISNNDVDAAGAELISLGLQLNNRLTTLNVSGNKIGSKGGLSLASALQINVALERLDVGDTDQDIDSIIAFTTVLGSNRTLTALVLDRPLLRSTQKEESSIHVARMLTLNSTLTELSLRKHSIADLGVSVIGESLLRNSALQILDLSWDGVTSLAKALANGVSVRVLNLDSNAIDDAGVTALCAALPQSKVQFIGIAFNKICGSGMDSFSQMLATSKGITGFRVWGNPAISGAKLDNGVCARLSSAVAARSDLNDIDIRGYEVDGCALIAYGK